MNDARSTPAAAAGRAWLPLAAQWIGAVSGAVASYAFGARIGGMPMAALMAVNGAFFGSIMVAFVFETVGRLRARR